MTSSRATLALPRWIRLGFRAYGIDFDAIAERAGIDPNALLTPSQLDGLMEAAISQVSDPCAGLHFNAKLRPELFGIAGFACLSAPNLHEAFRRLARYKGMATTDRLELVRTRDGTRLIVTVGQSSPRVARLRGDFELTFYLRFASLATGCAIVPLAVAVRGQPACPRSRYDAVFGVPVRIGAPDDEITFTAADLARPLITHNAELSAMFVTAAEQRLHETAGDIVERVRAAVAPMLRGASPTLEAIASRLAMSERSLQRALAECDTSFTRVVDDVRREIAGELLADPAITREEVAYLLGFARASSLHRAVARWRYSPSPGAAFPLVDDERSS